jgi:predicted transcriptional regulator
MHRCERMKESPFKRSRLDLYYYILKSCIINEKHSGSSLNRQLSISYSLLDECLFYLEKSRFIEINYAEKTIKTTLKGKDYVQKFGYLMQQVDNISNLST